METVEIPVIEKEIQEFIFDRIGEKVQLDLGTEGQVAIKPICRHGSTILGIFWCKVLQHPNNYPVQAYPYRRLYKAAGQYVVSLRVDTVCIQICLATGKLTISGAVALDWFVMRFSSLLASYTQPVSKGQELKDPFDAEESRMMRTNRKEMTRKYLNDWPDVVIEGDMDILDARQILKNQEEEAGKADDIPTNPLFGEKPTEQFHIDNLLSPTDLETQLETLKQGVMTDGATLYAVWTTLLNQWFSEPDTKVFIVTPALDDPSLERLCHLVLNHRITASLEMLATPLQSSCGQLANIRREVMLKLSPRDQVFAEYKVYNCMVYPRVSFQAKFIAGLCGDAVQVLLTSADAKTKHFQAEHSSMALFQTLSAAEFDTRLLAPIVASKD